MARELETWVPEVLKRYDSPTLSNAIERFDVRSRDEGFMTSDVRCMHPGAGPTVGYAATATMRARGQAPDGPRDPAPLWEHVRTMPAPRLVVVADLDEPPAHGALWGEVMANTFWALGCVGAVTDGSVRDLDEVAALGFAFYARGVSVSHAYARVESAGDPVTVGGLKVAPGDLLHADQHGVLLIPKDIAAELPAAADQVMGAEQEFIGWLRSDDFDPDKIGEMRRMRH